MAQLAERAGGRIMRQMGRVGDNNDQRRPVTARGVLRRLCVKTCAGARRKSGAQRTAGHRKPEKAGLGSPRGLIR